MKIHHLSVTAFGPFAGTESVDFDALNDAGLFLLAGSTGAGKTSILDAVCFALYGTVPGVRGVKTLKSQHAGDEVQPEVVLEFSVRERRFRIRRSPEWSRPKRRGSGMLTEKAAASLAEIHPDGEHFLSSRAAEVGLMVSELIGMRAAQFQQVAMLPQGDFQRFLHASTQDRHEVLQHLFQTDRFARIEEWVNDHSRKLRQRSEGGATTVQQLLHTLAERAEAELPEELADGTSTAVTPEAALTWATGLVAIARDDLKSRRAAHSAADAELATTRGRLEGTRRVVEATRRRDEALHQLATLEASGEVAARAAASLDASARAAACLPVLELRDRALTELDAAARARAAALDSVARAELPEAVAVTWPVLAEAGTEEALEGATLAVRTLLTQVEGLLPRSGALESATVELASTMRDIEAHRSMRDEASERREALPGLIAEARRALAAASATAGRREAISLQVDAARLRAETAALVPVAEEELRALQDVVRDRRDASADAREQVQRLGALRLAGIAAELAGRLRAGEPCQVCGSADHPAPAEPGTEPVTDAEQDHAAAHYDAAQEALLVATETATTAQRRLEGLLSGAAGLSPEQAAAERDALVVEQSLADAAEVERTVTEERVRALTESLEVVTTELAELDTRLATLAQRQEGLQQRVRDVRAEIAALLGDVDPAGLDALARGLRTTVTTLSGARSAVAGHDRAAVRLAELDAQAVRTAAEHGFDSLDAVREAALPDAERAALDALLAERSDLAARARAVLADPDVLATGATPAPDLSADEEATAAAEEASLRAARSFHLQEQRLQSLTALVDRLADALESWAPVREDYVRAESMSRLVRGMGSDNHLQMRLSAYVLATRLDQVLDAANERLSHMRDQRYLLQRTGRAARKGSQAGLGLEVVDQWTGDVRDPATLSGGETFVVSLSLALGLADVVTQEAGGTEIDTLFVDEGFGTLDADTLDDVMDRLDGLRAGGRTVGVVSHVSEMRNRIPTQVHVEKRRTGSSVAVRTLAG
jgi:exonuclease SbcC